MDEIREGNRVSFAGINGYGGKGAKFQVNRQQQFELIWRSSIY
jgi:hypothetical protein